MALPPHGGGFAPRPEGDERKLTGPVFRFLQLIEHGEDAERAADASGVSLTSAGLVILGIWAADGNATGLIPALEALGAERVRAAWEYAALDLPIDRLSDLVALRPVHGVACDERVRGSGMERMGPLARRWRRGRDVGPRSLHPWRRRGGTHRSLLGRPGGGQAARGAARADQRRCPRSSPLSRSDPCPFDGRLSQVSALPLQRGEFEMVSTSRPGHRTAAGSPSPGLVEASTRERGCSTDPTTSR